MWLDREANHSAVVGIGGEEPLVQVREVLIDQLPQRIVLEGAKGGGGACVCVCVSMCVCVMEEDGG